MVHLRQLHPMLGVLVTQVLSSGDLQLILPATVDLVTLARRHHIALVNHPLSVHITITIHCSPFLRLLGPIRAAPPLSVQRRPPYPERDPVTGRTCDFAHILAFFMFSEYPPEVCSLSVMSVTFYILRRPRLMIYRSLD
ncbi:hypothetical protein BDW62DRAFT_187309 [Aspergillus aurantiobrunneus]